MFNSEVRSLLFQVICSWQVWAVTVTLIIYIFLVNYVARLYRRRFKAPMVPVFRKIKPVKPEKGEENKADSEDIEIEEDSKVK